MNLAFRSLSEDRIGTAWRAVFDHGWPGWRAWYLKRLGPDPVPLETCRRMLRRYMPGMERSWETWVSAVDGDEDVARFLTFWTPPRYLVNCSQLAGLDADGPFLIRNYDLDPQLNEATLLRTGWHGRRVIGMVEGMAGLSDGMNEAGLAVSLTFGGRIERGTGFGIPLIMRYVLETCRDTRDALAAFRDIPCHMSYNVTLVDRAGNIENLMLSPDRPVMRRDDRWATNHQLDVEWPRHGRLTQTLARGAHLQNLVDHGPRDCAALADQFIVPPLHTRRYDQGFGTVFTAIYRPAAGQVSLMWGDGVRHGWSFADFPDRTLRVSYGHAGSRADLAQQADLAHDESQRIQAISNRNQLEALDHWTNLNPIPEKTIGTGEHT